MVSVFNKKDAVSLVKIACAVHAMTSLGLLMDNAWKFQDAVSLATVNAKNVNNIII